MGQNSVGGSLAAAGSDVINCSPGSTARRTDSAEWSLNRSAAGAVLGLGEHQHVLASAGQPGELALRRFG
ncbi:MAG: hypothetical protein ACRDRV_16865 [Pseudonocardiaceae bacterium]